MLYLDLASVTAFLQPDETASDFLQRQAKERLHTGLPWLDQGLPSLRPGMLLELCGPTGSAKSEILTQARLLPSRPLSTLRNAPEGGKRPVEAGRRGRE
jgi:hypothetical protein